MDISICTIDKSNTKLLYAGAFRPLIKIKNGAMEEYRGNRFPIGGGSSYKKTTFTTHEITIKKGDNFYMFSDGFPDQFGGIKEKKYMNKQFKKLLMTINPQPSSSKLKLLEKAFTDWKGEIEQLDDILVLGFEI